MRRLALAVSLGLLVGGCAQPARIDVGVTAGVAVTTTVARSAPATSPATSRATPATTALAPIDGRDGVGDEYYPTLGNSGYDVQHYRLELTWDHAANHLGATTTITARAPHPLRRFNLDFAGFEVSRVRVNATDARFSRVDEELSVEPSAPVSGMFSVAVDYSGTPETLPDGPIKLGWVRTAKGSYTFAEPNAAHYWFPSNDHPSDKATFTFVISVPPGVEVVASGRRVSAADGRFEYEASDQMAPYLASVATGPYVITTAEGPRGLPLTEIDPATGWDTPGEFLPVTIDMLLFFEERFGPFPLESYGLLMADSTQGVAMEHQTLSMFSAADMDSGRGDDELFLAHEIAHQWFGDAVSPERWVDIWLNESFATYSEWLWSYRDKPEQLEREAEQYRARASTDRSRAGPTGRPKFDDLFGTTVYQGGAIVLHALRREVGDDVFFRILRSWVETHGGGAAGTDEFVALAGRVADRDLTDFFQTWLFATALPPFPVSR